TRLSVQGGRPPTGNMAPLRKNMGGVKKFMIRVKPCMDRILAAAAIPIAVREKEMYSSRGRRVRIGDTVSFTPMMGAKTSMRHPCSMATVLPPNVFPMATAQREMGATITSFKKPISRSQMMEIAEKTAVKRIVMAMIPG